MVDVPTALSHKIINPPRDKTLETTNNTDVAQPLQSSPSYAILFSIAVFCFINSDTCENFPKSRDRRLVSLDGALYPKIVSASLMDYLSSARLMRVFQGYIRVS